MQEKFLLGPSNEKGLTTGAEAEIFKRSELHKFVVMAKRRVYVYVVKEIPDGFLLSHILYIDWNFGSPYILSITLFLSAFFDIIICDSW